MAAAIQKGVRNSLGIPKENDGLIQKQCADQVGFELRRGAADIPVISNHDGLDITPGALAGQRANIESETVALVPEGDFSRMEVVDSLHDANLF